LQLVIAVLAIPAIQLHLLDHFALKLAEYGANFDAEIVAGRRLARVQSRDRVDLVRFKLANGVLNMARTIIESTERNIKPTVLL